MNQKMDPVKKEVKPAWPISRLEMNGAVYKHTLVVLQTLKEHVDRRGYDEPIAFDDLLQLHANAMNRIQMRGEGQKGPAQNKGETPITKRETDSVSHDGEDDDVCDVRKRKLLTRRLYDVISVMEALDMIAYIKSNPNKKAKNKHFFLKGASPHSLRDIAMEAETVCPCHSSCQCVCRSL